MNRLSLQPIVPPLLLLILTGIFISGPIYSTGDPAIARYSFDNCQSYFTDGSHQNYSELTATFTNRANVQMLDQSGSLYRLNPTENPHSCTPGLNGTIAMCVGTTEDCSYVPNAADAVRFDIRLIPSGNQFVRLSKLDFFELAPFNFEWIDGFSSVNNYPTKYGLRISVNGTTIYQQQDIPTTQNWTLESYSFVGLPQFTVSEETVFNFELFAYCPAGISATQRVWDLEDITIVSECLDQKITNGGQITGGPFTVCVDGEADFLPAIGLAGATGQNSSWIFTDEAGNILALTDNPSSYNLDASGSGDCLLLNISYQNGIGGLQVGSNVANLTGIFDFSNSITINKSQPLGGSLNTPSPIVFCIDGIADNVTDLTLSGNSGVTSSWIVTNDLGTIIGLPQNIEDVNFDVAGAGNCFIWNVSYAGTITGLSLGSPLNQLDGCLGISNGVQVTRILVEAPILSAGPFTFCKDGQADMIDVETPDNSTWNLLDENSVAIQTIPELSQFNFDALELGTYTVRLTLTDEDQICSVESNPIIINLVMPVGGTIEGGPFNFCIDGVADNVSDITISGNEGNVNTWIVTDEDGEILGLPADITAVNFEDAGIGSCLIYNASSFDSLMNISVGIDLSDIEGCFALSNSITVIRSIPAGGTLTGGPFDFCIDDESDFVSGITLSDNEGTNSNWVVTDSTGMILGLPDDIEAVDFNAAGGGICFIYNVSFEDGLQGLTVDANLDDLQGCFNLSNSISVNRTNPLGGTLAGGPFSFCVDGIEDRVSGITLTGNSGVLTTWIVTDQDSIILGLPAEIDSVNFDEAGAGTCLIWSISHGNDIEGLEADSNLSDLEGCFALSNSITVNRTEVNGGTLTGGPFDFCIDDESDFVSGITISDSIGTNINWVVTDSTGMILGLHDDIEAVDFNEAGGGICLIYNIGFDDGLQGLALDANLSDLEGCFNLSNSISVNRTNPLGGTLEGGPFNFCVDGTDDRVSGITLTGNSGVLTTWIVTDQDSIILGLPAEIDSVNFDEAGAGSCLIWSISHGNDLEGLEVDGNLADLEGCFAISNNLTVNRSEVNGGTLTGGPFSFCIDGTEDNVDNITLADNIGPNTLWVVTDTSGVILGLPDDIEDVNFDEAGVGTCLIWSLSTLDELSGLTVGENISDLEGCFSFSNSITVVRSTEEGGTLTGGPFEFMIDGTPDFVSGITLADTLGSNYSWLITDEDGIILGLPDDPEMVDFDAAGIGVCLIWNIAFADGLTGLEVDGDILDLEGCFDLSNNIMVTRSASAGGLITGGPFSFCIDDTPDMVSGIELTNNMGTNSQWVVTDSMGVILGLPDDIEDVDFNEAGIGVCLIYHLSHEDNITDLAIGNNLSDLGGTFGLSNSISVTRSTPVGGMLTGGPFEFCVNGIPDMVSGIELTGAEGETIIWIVTDQEGLILGIPTNIEDVNFDDAGAGTCLIHSISYIGTINGLEVDGNLTGLSGCFDLSSNNIQVVRTEEEGGTLEGGPFNFCVDMEDDFVSGITLTGAASNNNIWVVTDEDGLILGLPADIETVNFNDAGPGVCLIYNISSDMTITGLEVDSNLNDIEGCFGLSNAITVTRVQTSGGVIAGPMSFTFQIDGTPDMATGLSLSSNTGTNTQWVVFTVTGNIIALPANIEDVNFDDFGVGTCFIASISFEDGLTGLALNEDIAELDGCFGVSNNIEVTKVASAGGVLEGGPFSFCIDGEADMVSGLTLTDNSGTNSDWLVTASDGEILGLPDDINTVDFDLAGPGVCSIYNISYESGLTGLAVGNNLSDLDGVFGLSNPVLVNRGQPDGGVIAGGPYDLCIDGTEDFITDITTADISGTNTTWAITDGLGIILVITEEIDTINFDLAGGGTCSIYNVSFETGIGGLEVDADINELTGCFDLSNSIDVNRTELNGGNLEGGPFSFCIDDDPDMATGISLTDVVGPNTSWIVSDTAGVLLAVEVNLGDIDFNELNGGTCFINHMAFSNGLTGLMVGNNFTDLAGCFDLSQSLEVNKLQPEGGVVVGDDLSICIDDDPDFITSASVTGAGGADTTLWLITDPGGIILDTLSDITTFDFNESNFDTCVVWNISYMNGITGLFFGENIADLDGCFDISNNNIMVFKSEPDGGILSPQSFNICIDGMPDLLDIELTSTTDPNLAWIISDANGLIVMLPMEIDTVDFDQFPIGTCFVNSISFDLGLTGLSVGNNLSALDGCFDLSNTVQVAKEDCIVMSNDSIVINEISEEEQVEIKNVGNTTIDVSGYTLLQAFFMAPLNMISLDCGTLMLAPGDILVANVNFNINGSTGEMGLLNSEGTLIDYVEWGGSNHANATAASNAGIWLLGSGPAPAFDEPETLEYDGVGNASTDWSVDDETLCSDNLIGPINPTELNYSLYPNPANGELFVELDSEISEEMNINIYDPFGKLLMTSKKGIGSAKTSSMNVSELKEGAYIFIMSTKSASKAVRFMKIN